MTRNTNSNYIKPMLRDISQIVMVLLCLFAARTLQSANSRHFTCFDGVINSAFCFDFSQIIFMPFTLSFVMRLITSFCFNIFWLIFFLISLAISLTVFSLTKLSLISFSAIFAATLKSIFRSLICIKFRDWFDLLASTAFFRYDFVRHNQFLNSWLCLEPVTRYALVVGSFNSNYYPKKRKEKL